MRFVGVIGAVCIACLLFEPTANAGSISKVEAQKRVTAMEKDQDDLLAHAPALRQIDQVLRDDCAAKVSGHTGADSFCTCGVAVTMSLWRSGVDPKMIDRLKDFLNGSGTLTASEFVKFEGPELYRPLCELGA